MEATPRETKELTIGNHTLTVLTYLTGREYRAINANLVEKLEIKQNGNKAELQSLKGEFITMQEDERIAKVVQLFDGSAERIVDRIVDLPNNEYAPIIEAINNIAEGKGVASN